MLVRKAYEQGRLLDAHDLTDDALYRLISKDEMIRVLVTREIEDRGYVHVKPTQEELAREQALRSVQASPAEAAQQEADVKSGKSQEEAYWSRRQKELLNENAPTGETSPAQQQLQPKGPSQPPQQMLPSVDQRRALERAQAQYYEGDYATGLPLDVFGMQRVGPDQLSSVLSTQGAGRSRALSACIRGTRGNR